jgi:hypothetical protein
MEAAMVQAAESRDTARHVFVKNVLDKHQRALDLTDDSRRTSAAPLVFRNQQIVDVEVYFGWSLPHKAARRLCRGFRRSRSVCVPECL